MLTRRRALWALPLLLLALVAAALFALTPAQPADAQTAQTFVSNLGQADSGTEFLSHDLAQAFTTGSNSAGYSLRSVGVNFSVISSGFSSSHLTASIHTDSSGSPGTSLGTLTNPASFPVSSSTQTLTFTSAGIDLAASTTYFLVIDMSVDRGSDSVSHTGSDSEDSGHLAGWSISDGYLDRAFSGTASWGTSLDSLRISLGGISKTPPPVVSITGGRAVTEGGSATFTLTATPAPSADLPVSVTVTTSGDFGFGTLPTSVTIPTSGSATLTITTTDDDVSEPDGSVTVTLVDGAAYDLSTLTTATVRVEDDEPTLLVSNFRQANTATGSFQSHDHAQAFTTGSNADGYTLTAVDFSFPSITAGDLASKLSAAVHSDSSGEPGAKVADLTVPGTIASGVNSFTQAGLQLEPDTTYWVVLAGIGNAPAGTNNIQNTASDAEDAGSAEGWSISDTALYRNRGGGSWTSLSQSRKIHIVGEVNALRRNQDGSYTVPFDWPLKPPGVASGGTFRLLFITDDWRDATSASIDDYDAHVRDAAREGHAAIRPYADQFLVVGSTAAVDARDHTRTNPNNAGHPDAPIWWLNGQRVAANNAGFWSNTWENWELSDRRFETGERDTDADWPWTGTMTAGTKHGTDHLGNSGNVGRGRFWAQSGDTGPIDWNRVSSAQQHAFYGISPVFRVATTLNAPSQEPAVLSNLDMPDGGAHDLTGSQRPDRAQSFTTGNNGGHYRLTSVDLSFVQVSASNIGNALRVKVMADRNGAPDWNTELATLATPSIQVSSTEQTYTFTYAGDGAGLELEPNTTYWVVIMDASSILSGTNTLRATASNSERIQGLPLAEGWSIGDGHRYWRNNPPATSWSTHSEALKIGLNLGAAEPFVQFRTCAGTVSGNSCDTGWVVANYTRHDPPPTITLTEGGPVVTYQWRAVDPKQRRHFYVTDQVTEPLSNFGGYMGPGGPDRDRLMCHTGSRDRFNLGDPIVYVPRQSGMNIGYGSTAGPLLDRHDGCPFAVQSIYEHDPNKWRPVSVAAGQDSDAFDHLTQLIHTAEQQDHGANTGPDNGYVAFPVVEVPVVIRDDDEWEQGLEFSIDDGATWTSIQDGGLSLAFPRSLNTGRKAHYFWVRLTNDPPADQNKRIHITANFANQAPLNTGTTEYFRSYRVWLTSPAADPLHTFRAYPETGAAGSATVSRTPIQIEINVGDNFAGNVTFDFEGFALYERSDNQISTETPPKVVRTKNFSFYRTLGACVGCQRLLGDLPDPVVERVGDVSYANLSDTGIDLSWPRVVGAEGYEVRYWSTTSPFPGVPAEEAWFGAEPNDPAWNIRHLEPDTEYRAVVYYADHGATQLSTASPVIRFTTLSAGSPVQAEPTSVIVERVPEVSISAASGTITEGEDAVFTVSVEPAPDAPLDVRVRVAGPSAGSVVDGTHLGARTVNVPTGGSASFTIPTVDDVSWASNGMLGASVTFGEGYRLNKFRSHASVYIANNDLPPPPRLQLKEVSDTTMTVAWKPQGDGTQYTVGWHESFAGIPVVQWATTTETEHQITGLDPKSHYAVFVLAGSTNLGQLIVRTLAAGATAQTFPVDFETPTPNTSLPVVSVTSDGDVTEGGDASFTVTANPAPDADLDVSVTVSQSGDYGAATGQQTVTIPTAGYATLTVATTNDELDEEDGSVTVTIDTGEGYLVSTTQGATAVAVSDPTGGSATLSVGTTDDNVQSQGGTITATVQPGSGYGVGNPSSDSVDVADNDGPVITITGGAAVTEGGDATFTLTANPAPSNNWLSVSVTIGASGEFGVSTGARTVSVPLVSSHDFTVATTDDNVDEPDGAVTATVKAGYGYRVGDPAEASVAVNDDEATPVNNPVITITGGPDTNEGEDATFTLTATPPLADGQSLVVTLKSEVPGLINVDRKETVTGGSATFTQPSDDNNYDEADYSMSFSIKASNGYRVGSPSKASVTIIDDDLPKVKIRASKTSVEEDSSVIFTVSINPHGYKDETVSVQVTAAGDFGVPTGTRQLTVPVSPAHASFRISPAPDHDDEPDGSITARIVPSSGYEIVGPPSVTVVVKDDDEPSGPRLTISDAPDKARAGEKLVFPVVLSQAAAGTVTVDYELGTFSPHLWPGEDFQDDDGGTSGTITFAAGEVSKELDVHISPDAYFEHNDRIYVELSNLVGDATLPLQGSWAEGRLNAR